jgi:hypothetical protein
LRRRLAGFYSGVDTLALGGIAVAVWARLDDWKKGLR